MPQFWLTSILMGILQASYFKRHNDVALQVILKYYKNIVFLVAKYDTFWLVHDIKHSNVATTVSVQNEVYNVVQRMIKAS